MIKSREQLFTLMSAGATVITPNNRLSNQLLHDFYLQQGSVMKDKPLCLPYQAFLRDLFTKARHRHADHKHPVLFSALQQRHLWRQILSDSQNISCNDGLVHEIHTAWTRCQHWRINIDDPAFMHTPQTRQFQQWQKKMVRALASLDAITEEQLVEYILHYTDIFNHTSVIWVSFDDYTPQQRCLQKVFDMQSCQQYYYDLTPKPITTKRFAANDTQDERLQMVEWLKNRLAAGETRIGVVVPELQMQYRPMQRFLQRHLPHDQFSLSLGKPLTDYPLVTHALAWLGLDKGVTSNHQARLLLNSPYLSGAKFELLARSQTLYDSKLFREAELPFDNLLEEFSLSTPKLAKLMDNLTIYPEEATVQIWIDLFKTRLINLGFPGEYPLNSATYQCFQRFIGIFDELLQLSVISPVMSKKTVLDALHDLAKSTIFQTRKATSPIQILGLLEASGCTFDSVWVCGLTDQCLPKRINLSAFIPLDLQRDYEMPHAVATRELQFAQQLLQRLQHGSQQSIFSYPCLAGDMPNLPCPLIVDLPVYIGSTLQTLAEQSSLIQSETDYVIPFRAFETISGGTSLLANQAKCPFRAFAAHRLHAHCEAKPSTGPDVSERGQILHRIMELVWQQIESQQHLHSITTETLNILIDTTIHDALQPYIKSRPLSFPPLVQSMELIRLRRLVLACLAWEKQRPAFVIEALEKTFILNLAGIDFRVRIDRLDKLISSDKKWVIDYKSSIPVNKPWNEDRPEAPQLLLYALLDNSINTLLFIQLKAGRITCNGISEETSSLKGINGLKKNERWSDHREQWQQQLTDLAGEFRDGYCQPQPNRESTCNVCEFSNLCRI